MFERLLIGGPRKLRKIPSPKAKLFAELADTLRNSEYSVESGQPRHGYELPSLDGSSSYPGLSKV